jgi:hypothetical protein
MTNPDFAEPMALLVLALVSASVGLIVGIIIGFNAAEFGVKAVAITVGIAIAAFGWIMWVRG